MQASSSGLNQSSLNSVYGSTPKPILPASALYTALFDYKPCKPDELELFKGRLYCVVEKCMDGWFRGSCVRTNASGVFPGNYVQIVKPVVSSQEHGVYNTPSSSQYQRVNPPPVSSHAVQSSSPPPLKPKTFFSGITSGWKSSELLGGCSSTADSNCTPNPVYARPKPRTLPLNFSKSDSKHKRRSKSPPATQPASTPSPQWQPV